MLLLTGDIIKEYAKNLGQHLSITDFECSNGWLDRFKKRRGLSQYIRCGETANIDEDRVMKGREKIRELISEYKLADVYNMDESGSFYSFATRQNDFQWSFKKCK